MLATLVALELPPLDEQAWQNYLEDAGIASREANAAELYGQLLGADPQGALQNFVSFAIRARSSVT